MAHALGAPLLLVCSSTSQHASADLDAIARDLRKLAMLAVPLGIRIAYEGLSWGRTINEFTSAWQVVQRADAPNLGLGFDSYHALATKTALDGLEQVDARKIFLVQLADFMWQETRTVEERISTARTFRVFPGEGVHSAQVAELVQRLDAMGYRGDYSFEVFNDDYQQLPLPLVALRARAFGRMAGRAGAAPRGAAARAHAAAALRRRYWRTPSLELRPCPRSSSSTART